MHGRGFTLIEMLVVLALLAMLAAGARPMLELSVQRTKEYELRSALRALRSALDEYKRAADAGRVSHGPGDSGYPPTLQALTEGVADMKSPMGLKIYFLRRLPRDPFADKSLAADATWGLRASDSPAADPRVGRDVFDVFSRSERKALDGSFYRDW